MDCLFVTGEFHVNAIKYLFKLTQVLKLQIRGRAVAGSVFFDNHLKATF